MADENKVKQYHKEYQQKNKERKKEYQKKWYQNNKQHQKEYRQKNKESIKKYRDKYYHKNKKYFEKYYYKKRYNLTLEGIDRLIIIQNNKCPICGKPLIKTKRYIDHDHKTKKIRGILCDKCNPGLGQFNDDPKLLRKAILYLETK